MNILSDRARKLVSNDQWIILDKDHKEQENLVYETLYTLTNGYMGTRGTFEEGAKKTLPYSFIHGIFDKSETFMKELVAVADWTGLKIYFNKQLLGLEEMQVEEYTRILDMKKGFSIRAMILKDKSGRLTKIEITRFLSRKNQHRMAIRLDISPLNYSGNFEIENIIDASIINFYDAPRFKVKHSNTVRNEALTDRGVYIETQTRDDKLHIACGAILDISKKKNPKQEEGYVADRIRQFGELAVEFDDCMINEGESISITKYASYYTDKDLVNYKEDKKNNKDRLKDLVKDELIDFMEKGFDEELEDHIQVYEKMWDRADIQIEGDDDLNKAIRFNIFHLMSTASPNNHRVNLGAKLLHGEEYGGHAFWDGELFMLPFFSFVFPEIAKNMVLYRYELLEAAEENARISGYLGAKYPWQSADDGSEQCPSWTIEPDGSCYRCYVADYEHHVTAAVTYGMLNYVRISGDSEFMADKGAEILLKTAKFWVDRLEYNEEKVRYEINRVTGPDEWHEPVDNNAYTNYLAAFNISAALEYIYHMTNSGEKLPENFHKLGKIDEILSLDIRGEDEKKKSINKLLKKSQISAEDIKTWLERLKKLYLPKANENNVIEQFEGYYKLHEAIITEYDENDWPIRPDSLKKYKRPETKILKQADVVMLMYLFNNAFDEEVKKANYDYYEKRTLHGSSLSPCIHSIMGLRTGDKKRAYRYLMRSAFLDLIDIQGNTREGFHAANSGGVWKIVVFGFAGVRVDENGILNIDPKLPSKWKSLKFKLNFRNTQMLIEINEKEKVKIKLLKGDRLNVIVDGEVITIDK